MARRLLEKAGPKSVEPPIMGIAGRAVATALSSSFLFGYSIGVPNSCSGLMAASLHWCGNDWETDCTTSRTLQSFVNSALYLGAAMGAWFLGRAEISARTSREHLMLSDVLFAAGAICCSLAQGAAAIVIGRFLSGVGMGICGIAAPVFIAEISPKERRGLFCCFHKTFISVGLLASIAFGLPQGVPPSDASQPVEGLDAWYWRCLLGFAAVPAVSQCFIFGRLWPIDPPGQLVIQGRIAEARALIFRTYGFVMQGEIAVTNFENCRLASELETRVNDLVAAAASAKNIERIRLADALGDPFFRCALWLGFFLAALQQLCGINALMSHSNTLFKEGGIASDHLTLASTVMCCINVCFSTLASLSADGWGRRSLLLLGTTLMALGMFLLSWFSGHHAPDFFVPPEYLGIVTVGCFTLFVVSFSAGLGAITWLYLSEIYPIEIRGSALSACGIVNWVCCFVVVFCSRFFTLHQSVKFFGIMTSMGALGIYLWIVETKGCTMDDSPLTPRSKRSTSTILTPSTGDYSALGDGDDSTHACTDDSEDS